MRGPNEPNRGCLAYQTTFTKPGSRGTGTHPSRLRRRQTCHERSDNRRKSSHCGTRPPDPDEPCILHARVPSRSLKNGWNGAAKGEADRTQGVAPRRTAECGLSSLFRPRRGRSSRRPHCATNASANPYGRNRKLSWSTRRYVPFSGIRNSAMAPPPGGTLAVCTS
jgi:hypothetical protein